MNEMVERLVRCGVNLVDALDIYEDFMYEDDIVGLCDYVCATEADYMRRLTDVD